MAKALTEKSLGVLNYLKENVGENMTAADIAEALGMERKSVDGIVTSGLIRNKNYVERVPAQIEVTDDEGNKKTKDIKFIKVTDAGLAYDHDAAVAEDEAAKAAKDAE